MRNLLLIALISLFSFIQVSAQNLNCVDDVSYTTDETKVLLLPQNTAFSDVHVYDIPNLKHTEKTKSHHEYVDDTGEIHHDIILTDAVNCHEEWENLANRWSFDQTGMTSYYDEPRGGSTLINQILYDTTTVILYNINKQTVLFKGILANKVYPVNIASELTIMNIPFVVLNPGVIMTTDSTTFTVFDENPPKTITKVTYKTGGPNPGTPPDPTDPDVIKADIRVFDTQMCGEYLLTLKVRIRNDTLSNGLCSKQVVTTDYTNYQFACCGPQPQISSSTDKFTSTSELKLYPNPFNSGRLTITLPESFAGKDILISLHTSEGKLIKTFSSFAPEGMKIDLNVNKYLNKQGLYLIRVVNEDIVLSKKFFFVK